MSGWLLDTNVLSALAPGRPPLSSEQVAWFETQTDALHLSAITVTEIEAGIHKLRRTGSDRRARSLAAWFSRIVTDYAERILPFDLRAAQIAAALADSTRAHGLNPGFADVAIAATARAHGLTVLTRNLRHFDPLGVTALDPFETR